MANLNWYQIDRYADLTGAPDMEYEMIMSTSRKQALIDYLVDLGYAIDSIDEPVTITNERINGLLTTVARCPACTRSYWTASKVKG